MFTKEAITKMLREKYPYLAAEYGVKRIGLLRIPHIAQSIEENIVYV